MANTALQIYNYQGSNITFKTENGTWVNATEMAKPFGKKPAEWLRLPSTAAFLEALFKVRFREGKVGKSHFENMPYFGFVVTERGGFNPCTWFHEDVALEFARWLSPEFAVWCNDRIKEMMIGGYGYQPPKSNIERIKDGYIALLEQNVMLTEKNAKLVKQLEAANAGKRQLLVQAAKKEERKQFLIEAPKYYSDFLGQTHMLDEPMKRVPLETIWIAFQSYCLSMGITYKFNRRSFASFMSEQPLGKVKTNKGVSFFKY